MIQGELFGDIADTPEDCGKCKHTKECKEHLVDDKTMCGEFDNSGQRGLDAFK
jgi:hypothetical protein